MEGENMYYLIKEILTPCSENEILEGDAQYVVVLTTLQWQQQKERFDMQIDMEMDTPQETKAVVNMDSLTGTLSIPDRNDIGGQRHSFSFALDEKGVVWVDDSGYVLEMLRKMSRTKKWRLPGLERFLYDLLEMTIGDDLTLLEKSEHRLNMIEESILRDQVKTYPKEMNDIRGDLLDLRVHYEQLIDLGQELEENENGFFKEENLRYGDIPRIEGVNDTLAQLQSRGYRMAVASSSTQDYIELCTDRAGIAHFFDVRFSAERVKNTKPAPDVFLAAAEKMGAAPEDCVVVEDSTNGTLAAKAAGMRCIGFANPDSPGQCLDAADLRIDRFAQLLDVL
jgi:magnesium transporter